MTNKLTFRNADLAKLRESALVQWEIDVLQLYGNRKHGCGYWLVGDDGVYLMHNGQSVPDVDRQPVAMSVECDPATVPDWQTVKRATFGGDDGVDYIEAVAVHRIIDAGKDMVVGFEGRHMEIYAAD